MHRAAWPMAPELPTGGDPAVRDRRPPRRWPASARRSRTPSSRCGPTSQTATMTAPEAQVALVEAVRADLIDAGRIATLSVGRRRRPADRRRRPRPGRRRPEDGLGAGAPSAAGPDRSYSVVVPGVDAGACVLTHAVMGAAGRAWWSGRRRTSGSGGRTSAWNSARVGAGSWPANPPMGMTGARTASWRSSARWPTAAAVQVQSSVSSRSRARPAGDAGAPCGRRGRSPPGPARDAAAAVRASADATDQDAGPRTAAATSTRPATGRGCATAATARRPRPTRTAAARPPGLTSGSRRPTSETAQTVVSSEPASRTARARRVSLAPEQRRADGDQRGEAGASSTV